MLVVDFMHEFELGVWKALFVHLIWILYAVAPSGRLVDLLDERYVAVFIHKSRRGEMFLELTGIAKFPCLATPSGSLQTTYRK